MSNEEKIQHKQTYVEYLKQLTSGLEKEIWDLQHLQVDPYAELKAAHAAGKRIAWYTGIGDWEILPKPLWTNHQDRYKIVDDDETYICTYWNYFVKGNIKVKITKCGLTGDVTAEVVE